ncbi:helix-turn-helix domain-containing protein [Flavobacterium sp. HNIBRBA15423]|uniref:helix-turn-helix domain-containing protein n=1 Tax=Flavobacterium sp. HNIBRBA15423 TaxID=3458683 RepID=UPI0040441AEA
MSLRAIRKEKGFTQKDMAFKMAMEQTTYSRKETGKSPITDEEWERFANVLETPVEELKKMDDYMTKFENCTFNEQSQAIGIQIVSMPKETLDVMMKYTAKLEEEINKLKEKLGN